MNYYVEIPYARVSELAFPNFCPYTLDENPNREWEVEGKTKREPAVSLPGVPIIVAREDKFIFRVPASGRFVKLQHYYTLVIAAFLLLICTTLAISVAFPALEKVPGVPEAVGAFLIVAIIMYLWKRWTARQVWIDYVGDEFVEVVFKRKIYVELFCELNKLTFQKKFFNFRWD